MTISTDPDGEVLPALRHQSRQMGAFTRNIVKEASLEISCFNFISQYLVQLLHKYTCTSCLWSMRLELRPGVKHVMFFSLKTHKSKQCVWADLPSAPAHQKVRHVHSAAITLRTNFYANPISWQPVLFASKRFRLLAIFCLTTPIVKIVLFSESFWLLVNRFHLQANFSLTAPTTKNKPLSELFWMPEQIVLLKTYNYCRDKWLCQVRHSW